MGSLPSIPDFVVTQLLDTPTVRIRDIRCEGKHRHKSAEERATRTQLVYPYRGIYVRHVGVDDAVAEPNQVLYFNAGENYCVSHPIAGGDSSFVVEPEESVLRDLVPKDRLLSMANRFASVASDRGSTRGHRHSLHCCATA